MSASYRPGLFLVALVLLVACRHPATPLTQPPQFSLLGHYELVRLEASPYTDTDYDDVILYELDSIEQPGGHGPVLLTFATSDSLLTLLGAANLPYAAVFAGAGLTEASRWQFVANTLTSSADDGTSKSCQVTVTDAFVILSWVGPADETLIPNEMPVTYSLFLRRV